MMTRTTATIAFLVFLAGFSAFKYLSAAPPAFDPNYAVSVAILVVLTGVAPWAIAIGIGKQFDGTLARWVAALITAVVACCSGYGLYWAMVIGPNFPEVPMIAVALRGLISGPIEGLLAGLWLHANTAAVSDPSAAHAN